MIGEGSKRSYSQNWKPDLIRVGRAFVITKSNCAFDFKVTQHPIP